MTERPAAAVVVPSYNRSARLLHLLEHLEGQTAPAGRFEVVVVDDGSTDETPEALAGFAAESKLAVRVLRTPNGGQARARNRGWKATSAPFLAFIDDDCLPDPGWLEAGLAALEADERVGVVQGRTALPDGAQLGDWTVTREVDRPSPFFESHNIFYRREALEAAGGFDERVGRPGEDTALGWAVVERGWRRAFAGDALVAHELAERGLAWHVRNEYLNDRNLVALAARYPTFRRAAFWRPWAFQRHHAHLALAVAGLGLAAWRRPAALLVIPYLRVRDPGPHHRRWALLAERVLVDGAGFAGRKAAAVRHRCLVV